jgi:hypothetical protein
MNEAGGADRQHKPGPGEPATRPDPTPQSGRLTGQLEAKFPNHTTVVIYGAGHFVASDAADEMSRAIRGWWSGSAGQKRPDNGADC